MDYAMIRQRARETQRKHLGPFILLLLATGFAVGAISGVTSSVPTIFVSMLRSFIYTRDMGTWVRGREYLAPIAGLGALAFVGQVVAWLAMLVIEAFKTYSWLAPSRRTKFQLDDGIRMIQEAGFWRVFQTALLVALYTFLWSLLFIIPGIVKSYGYSMALYILLDRPELTPNQAIRESQALMVGKKGGLFGLEVTYQLFMVGVSLVLLSAAFTLVILGVGRESAGLIVLGTISLVGTVGVAVLLAFWLQMKIGIIRAVFYETALHDHGLKPWM